MMLRSSAVTTDRPLQKHQIQCWRFELKGSSHKLFVVFAVHPADCQNREGVSCDPQFSQWMIRSVSWWRSLRSWGSSVAEAWNPQFGPFWLKEVVPYTLFICGRLLVTIPSVFPVLQATLTRASVDDSAQRPVSIAMARFVAGVLHSIGHSLWWKSWHSGVVDVLISCLKAGTWRFLSLWESGARWALASSAVECGGHGVRRVSRWCWLRAPLLRRGGSRSQEMRRTSSSTCRSTWLSCGSQRASLLPRRRWPAYIALASAAFSAWSWRWQCAAPEPERLAWYHLGGHHPESIRSYSCRLPAHVLHFSPRWHSEHCAKKSRCLNKKHEKTRTRETSSSTCGQQFIVNRQEHNRSLERDVAWVKNSRSDVHGGTTRKRRYL